MSRNFALLFATLLMTLASYAELTIPSNIPGGERSRQRVELLKSELLKYFQANPEASTDEASMVVGRRMANAWKGYINNSLPFTVDDCLLEARSRLEKSAEKAFPSESEEDLQKRAEERYPLYKIGDRVKVLFMANPLYPSKVEGVFNGARNGYLRIGQSSIRIEDMKNVSGNDVEILKFNAEATEAKRKKFIREEKFRISDGRKDFIEKNEEAILNNTLKDFVAKNENSGFTFLDGEWLSPKELLSKVSQSVIDSFQQEQQLEKKAQAKARADIAKAQSDTIQLSHTAYPIPMRLNPSEAIKALETEKLKAEEAAQAAESGEKTGAEQGAAGQAQNASDSQQKKDEADAKEKEAQASDNANKTSDLDFEENKGISVIGIAGIVAITMIVLFIGIGIAVYIALRRKKEERKYTDFFEGKGEIQKIFWDKANADPEHFKYVAYMFPDEDQARNALLELSYISALPNGALKCTRNIDFGTYPHNGKAVAFIGGTELHYAPWREATAIMPELTNAQYFKVSTEPSVQLELPDMAGQDIDIKDLGREEVRTEDGSIVLCYKYSCESKDDALYFLENLVLNEESVMIQVKTPEGYIGKDMEGIFEMDNPMAADGTENNSTENNG